jgi:hypothetical protein
VVKARLSGVDRAALKAAARSARIFGFDAGLEEPLRSLAAGGTVSIGGAVTIEWPDPTRACPDGYALRIMTDGRAPTSEPTPYGYRWGGERWSLRPVLTELEPDLWVGPMEPQ